ncbi:MAG: hypothetical protein NDI94_04445 [Candidatus Woesearchaeota archaeon]|nr:hypothetical protein [Candidatus Woesearchaeota archaeon]
MYSNGSSNYSGRGGHDFLNDIVQRNFQEYFRAPIYLPAHINYRLASPYLSMKTNMPLSYGGMERYVLRSNVLNHVNLEYVLSNQDYGAQPTTSVFVHEPQILLNEKRPSVPKIEELSTWLKKEILKTFKLMMGFEMPDNILISVLKEDDLIHEHRKHARHWNEGIMGFAINRLHMNDFSSIFVKENPLDMLMLTIGHEIGHCLSLSKEDAILEEAKAFAFELAWMKTIHDFNILGLKESMNIGLLRPSENGLHNVALSFVRRQLYEKDALEIFKDISLME